MDLAESLGDVRVLCVPQRCVAVRNRNASCRLCVQACPVDAVRVEANEVAVTQADCVACGACVAACPTEALVSPQPDDESLAAALPAAMQAAGGRAVFACARIMSKGIVSPKPVVGVPCLARIDESLVVCAAAQGASEVLLVDGTCATCKYRYCDQGIQDTVDASAELLRACGGGVPVRRLSGFPDGLAQCLGTAQAAGAGGEMSRRELFNQAKDKAKSLVGKSADHMMGKQLAEGGPTLRDMLVGDSGEGLARCEPRRHVRLLDAMDAVAASANAMDAVVASAETAGAAGERAGETVFSRRFASVEVDADRCSACVMCVFFCPTGALKVSDAPPRRGFLSALEFSAAECVQCGLCADVCLMKCLEVSPVVSLGELFSFDPRRIDLKRKARRL